MRAPRIAFAIAFPVLSFLAPVLGVGNAAALPRDQGAPDSPKFYFPRQVKRQLGPFVNITTPDEKPTSKYSSSSTPPEQELPRSTSTGGLDDFFSSLLSPTGTPSADKHHILPPPRVTSLDPNTDTSLPDDIKLGHSGSSYSPEPSGSSLPPDGAYSHDMSGFGFR